MALAEVFWVPLVVPDQCPYVEPEHWSGTTSGTRRWIGDDGMEDEFVSYAFRDLPRKKIVKYARQYEGVDMTRLIGADEESFPFLVRDGIGGYSLMLWNVYNGMMEDLDEDPVRGYATVKYLLENAYPVFDTCEAALAWARDRNWPRESRNA